MGFRLHTPLLIFSRVNASDPLQSWIADSPVLLFPSIDGFVSLPARNPRCRSPKTSSRCESWIPLVATQHPDHLMWRLRHQRTCLREGVGVGHVRGEVVRQKRVFKRDIDYGLEPYKRKKTRWGVIHKA
ncbi:hypothetical protein H4582DRAFT_1965269 [Lactarius indigo]|nr:hypothetical protein H4582DRAFT_1965269 [Lactarius indigo]